MDIPDKEFGDGDGDSFVVVFVGGDGVGEVSDTIELLFFEREKG